VPKWQPLTHLCIPKCQHGNLTWMGQLCFGLEEKTHALTSFVLKNTWNIRVSEIRTVFYWKVRVSVWHAFEQLMWFLLMISLTMTHIVFCKFERNTCSTYHKDLCHSLFLVSDRWSKQSGESNTKCFHWLKIIWQIIPNFKNFIFRTSVLSFVAVLSSATWRESRT